MATRMRLLKVVGARKTYPTGDPSFAVQQPFPASLTTEEVDPFLMCDFFGPALSDGVATDPDEFPVDWHPHRGFDIATYMIEGRGRHADSMGNRETFEAPGMQWASVGSGIEHAEGGGTPAGMRTTGFQLWINVPSSRKNDGTCVRHGHSAFRGVPSVATTTAHSDSPQTHATARCRHPRFRCWSSQAA